jgi:hypothetical protein
MINVSTKRSKYARVFDRHNINWVEDHTQRIIFFTAQERFANDVFRTDGYLFLNDAYDMLGMKRTRVGQEVGWLKGYPKGDAEIRFSHVEQPNGKIWIDFNVHGPILELFDRG